MIISGRRAMQFAPQALGEVAPIANATGFFYGQPGTVIGDHYAAYGEMYRQQPLLASVVDKVSNAAARLSFQAWSKTDTGANLDQDSPFAKLLDRPCPALSRYAFWRWTFSTYEIYGEAYWMKMRNAAGQVIALYPMHPVRTEVKRAEDGTITYIFTLGVASAGLLTLNADDVVPFRRYNPVTLERGLSRIEPLRSTLADEDAARRANTSTWKRGARPSLMLSTDAKLSDGALKRLNAQISANHAGPDHAGGSLLLEEGMKPVPVQINAEQMEYIASRQLNAQEVCMVYDVPPPVVHILDHATFSNITEQMRSMYRDTMAPRLEDVESVIAHYLIPDFDRSGDTLARFALDEVLRGDFETRATAVGTLIQNGLMKPSEGRPLFDLGDAGPDADKLYANSALQELGMPAERVTLRATPPETPAQSELVSDATDDAAQIAADETGNQDKPNGPHPTGNGGKSLRRRRVRNAARERESRERSA